MRRVNPSGYGSGYIAGVLALGTILLWAADTSPEGWTRDFLLKVEGWAKDRDPNTAFSSSVEPLPFHAMSRYPYPANEHFPDDAEHRRYRQEYNTRPGLRLIRPLGGSQ